MSTTAMRFTALEWEILRHRLEVGDAIADALAEEYDGDEVAQRCLELERQGPLFVVLDELDLAILEDCCTGSTFFPLLEEAAYSGDVTAGAVARRHAAADRLEKKLGAKVARI